MRVYGTGRVGRNGTGLVGRKRQAVRLNSRFIRVNWQLNSLFIRVYGTGWVGRTESVKKPPYP